MCIEQNRTVRLAHEKRGLSRKTSETPRGILMFPPFPGWFPSCAGSFSAISRAAQLLSPGLPVPSPTSNDRDAGPQGTQLGPVGPPWAGAVLRASQWLVPQEPVTLPPPVLQTHHHASTSGPLLSVSPQPWIQASNTGTVNFCTS